MYLWLSQNHLPPVPQKLWAIINICCYFKPWKKGRKERERRKERQAPFVFVVQTLSVQLFGTPWTAARQASLSFTVSQSLLKLMSIESVILSNHLILCRPLLLLPSFFQASTSFPVSWLFTSGCQITGASASTSALPMNIQGWFL